MSFYWIFVCKIDSSKHLSLPGMNLVWMHVWASLADFSLCREAAALLSTLSPRLNLAHFTHLHSINCIWDFIVWVIHVTSPSHSLSSRQQTLGTSLLPMGSRSDPRSSAQVLKCKNNLWSNSFLKMVWFSGGCFEFYMQLNYILKIYMISIVGIWFTLMGYS